MEEHEDIVEADEPETLVVAEAVSSEDDADTVVPFYKREISFRRKKNAAEVVATAEVVDAVGDEDTSDASDEPAEVEVEPEFVAAVDEPEETEAVAEEPMRRRGGDVAEDDAAAEFVAAESPVEDDAPALEIVPVYELDQPGTDDGALEESALSRHHRARVAHGGRHARARRHSSPRSSSDVADVDDAEDSDDAALLPAAVAAEAVTDADALPDLP